MDWNFGDIILTMVAFFFWFSFVWMFIGAFSDILRRTDLSGWAKAGWIGLIAILPFLGVVVYMGTRPATATVPLRSESVSSNGHSRADEVSKLAALRDKGDITAEEFTRLKAGALA